MSKRGFEKEKSRGLFWGVLILSLLVLGVVYFFNYERGGKKEGIKGLFENKVLSSPNEGIPPLEPTQLIYQSSNSVDHGEQINRRNFQNPKVKVNLPRASSGASLVKIN